MHAVFYLMFDKEKAKNSEEARKLGFSLFEQEYCGEDGMTDWFVVGGRWSGELTKICLPPKKLKKIIKEFEKKYGWSVGGSKGVSVEDRYDQMKSLFKKHMPEFDGTLPFWRDTYKTIGYEDDAVIVDKEIYEKIISEAEGFDDMYEGGAVECVEGDNVHKPKNIIDKKWVIVIDFHS